MSVTGLCVACSRDRSGALVVRVGVPLADVYLEFLGGRSRPNTVLAMINLTRITDIMPMSGCHVPAGVVLYLVPSS